MSLGWINLCALHGVPIAGSRHEQVSLMIANQHIPVNVTMTAYTHYSYRVFSLSTVHNL